MIAIIVDRFLPLTFVAGGWWIVNRQNNVREARKECRAMADLAKKQTMSVATDAASYMTSDDDPLAFEIKSNLEALEIELDRFPSFARLPSPLMECFNEFADAVTGNQFESASRPKYSRTDVELLRVSRTRNDLLREIEIQFRIRFR